MMQRRVTNIRVSVVFAIGSIVFLVHLTRTFLFMLSVILLCLFLCA